MVWVIVKLVLLLLHSSRTMRPSTQRNRARRLAHGLYQITAPRPGRGAHCTPQRRCGPQVYACRRFVFDSSTVRRPDARPPLLDQHPLPTTPRADGRAAVQKPEKFPWAPPTISQALGDSFVDSTGAAVTLKSITDAKKYIAIYFSAHWCPPCRCSAAPSILVHIYHLCHTVP